MAETKNRLGKIDALVSLADWVWRNLSSLFAAILGGGLMTRWAAATEWASGFGPLGWGLIGLGTFAAIMLIMGWWTAQLSKSRLRASQARIADKLALTATFNPLEPRFERQVIRLGDFIKPDGSPIPNRRFEDCDLVGPMVVLLAGTIRYSDNLHSHVEFSKTGNEVRHLPNKLVLTDVEIRNCRIYNVVFLVPDALVTTFEAGFKQGIRWIN